MAERGLFDKPDRRRAATTLAVFGASLGAAFAAKRWTSQDRGSSTSDLGSRYGSLAGRGTPARGPTAESRRDGYEVADANVRKLVIVMAVSIAIMVIGVSAVFTMFHHFANGFQAVNKTLTAQQRAPVVPPLPHLQANPYRDIDAVLMEQAHRLNSFGWNDVAHTSAHIPIERAMQQVVGRNLDATATSDANGQPGTQSRFPADPAFNALIPQNKPANRVQGEGRPGAVAPSIGNPPNASMPGGEPSPPSAPGDATAGSGNGSKASP